MDTSETNNVLENSESNEQKLNNETVPKERSAEKQKLIQELFYMGFPKSTVEQIVDNAGDAPKNVLIEQLVIIEQSNSAPVVDDDSDDSMWEDCVQVYKMVIVINKGLNMGVGKIASQAAHAALGLYEVIRGRVDLINDLSAWSEQGSRKIVVEAKNTNELAKLCSAGKLCRIPFFRVHDAGLTEVAPNSLTAIAFFGSNDELKPITGKLKLLK